MTFDISAPVTPPEPRDTPVPSRGSRFRSRMGTALSNRLLLSVTLLIVLAGLVAQTLLFARETPSRRALSNLYMDSYEALSATKSAYLPELIFVSPASKPILVSASLARNTLQAHNYRDVPNTGDRHSLPASRVTAPRKVSTQSKTPAQGERAIDKWRGIVKSKQAKAAEWRRMGIVLALFHRPGAQEAFAHVGDKFPPASASSRPKRASMESGNSDVDPFGHGRTGISVPQELAAWQTLYGTGKITTAQVPDLRNTLKQLRLGWFEDVALAQLYQKADLHTEAWRMAEEADHTVRAVNMWENVHFNGLLLGFAGLFVWGALGLARLAQPNGNRINEQAARAFYAQTPAFYRSTPSNSGNAPIFAHQAGQPNRIPFLAGFIDAPPALIASALLLAFITYLVGHTIFGLLFSYALHPFSSRMDALSATQLLRLNFGLECLLYIPIFFVPLWTLRARLMPFALSKQSFTLRRLLAHLGWRARSLFAEIKASAIAYLLLMPGLLLAGLVSHALFHRFHTPVNSAQFQTMAAQHLLDKALIFILAAVIAPIVEETMFRGLLYSALRSRFGVWGAAMLSAATFSLVHPTLPGGFLNIWAVGIALALVYERRGSLVPCMLLHGIYNGLITLLGFAVFGQ